MKTYFENKQDNPFYIQSPPLCPQVSPKNNINVFRGKYINSSPPPPTAGFLPNILTLNSISPYPTHSPSLLLLSSSLPFFFYLLSSYSLTFSLFSYPNHSPSSLIVSFLLLLLSVLYIRLSPSLPFFPYLLSPTSLTFSPFLYSESLPWFPHCFSLSLFSLLPSSSLTLFPHRLSSFSLPSLLMVYLLLLFSHVLPSSIFPSFVTLFSPYPFPPLSSKLPLFATRFPHSKHWVSYLCTFSPPSSISLSFPSLSLYVSSPLSDFFSPLS